MEISFVNISSLFYLFFADLTESSIENWRFIVKMKVTMRIENEEVVEKNLKALINLLHAAIIIRDTGDFFLRMEKHSCLNSKFKPTSEYFLFC